MWLNHWINTSRGANDNQPLGKTERDAFRSHVFCLEKHFKALELVDALPIVTGLLEQVDHATAAQIRGQLLSIKDVLTEVLANRVFMYVPVSLIKYARPQKAPYNHTAAKWPKESLVKPFGSEVYEHFVDARCDAEEMALCITAGASTAAVFHAMRVVEWGIRSLGAALSLKRVKEHIKKTGKNRLKPIESCTWEVIGDQLRAKIKTKCDGLRPGEARDFKQINYNNLLLSFGGFKDAWRNHVMHTRLSFTEEECLRIVGHVTSFMVALQKVAK